MTLIQVDDLQKTFFLGVMRKRVDAVKGVSFSVQSNEIFGFLGPNGSGKTTTIKMLTGLIQPSGGKATLFGHPILSGLKGPALRDRATQVMKRTGIEYAGERPVRRLSKGMGQRSALAAALVADPELLVLDEPMSGLDPIGRKEVRDIILSERREGRTVFFSTHILADAESLCDRVTILREGRAVVSGALRDLVRGDVLHTDLTLAQASEELEARFRQDGHDVHRRAGLLVVEVKGQEKVNEALAAALQGGAQVVEVTPRRETLEDLFVRRAIDA
jgi:ABC-2 type transport system ATP-binding protein